MKKYIEEAAKTDLHWSEELCKRFSDKKMINLWHAVGGLSTESNELLDQLIKHVYYGKKLDVVNIKEECGDILWFIAKVCRELDWSFEELMKTNIDKLKIRYPKGFTEKDALNRKLDEERYELEKKYFI